MINRGDALFHIARTEKGHSTEETLEHAHREWEEEPMFEEDEIH